MSGDLISRSALLEEMRKFSGNQRYLISEEVWSMVENAPMAYDMDKVVEQLKSHSMPFMGDKDDRDVDLNRAIKIVKSGGIE